MPSTTTSPSPIPVFGAPLLGQTEKALNAILEHELAGTGLSEQQWVTLTLTVTAGGAVDREALIGRVARALRTGEAAAEGRVDDLAAAGLVSVGAGSKLKPSEAGLALHSRIRAVVTEITGRLWGDLPAADLTTAAGVLATVIARADAELERD